MSFPIVQLAKFLDRFGNQVIQYACARAFAEKFGAILETPPWVGEQIFSGLTCRRWSCAPIWADYEEVPKYPNIVLHGLFQHQGAYDLMSKASLKKWLSVRSDLMALCPKPKPFYVACHIRHGDYLNSPHQWAIIERECYRDAVRENGYDEADVIWVSPEAPTCNPRLASELDFLHDYLVLLQADVLFRANSTFSQSAAMLSDGVVFSPNVTGKVGRRLDVAFERGNHCKNFDPERWPPHVVHTTCQIRE